LKKVFLIRADASAEMGAGHLMRTLALGQMLQDAACVVHFATIAHNADIIDRLIAENFLVHLLSAPFSECSDAASVAHIARSISASWIVIDGYHFTCTYEKTVQEEVPTAKIMTIDDVPRIHHSADVLLSQNYGAQNMVFSTEVSTQKLLGLEFLLLRREFKKARSEAKSASTHIPKRLLVTLGGGTPQGDSANLKIARALSGLDSYPLEVVFIAGKMSANKAELKACLNSNHRFLEFCDDVACEMSQADFAIVAGGSSMWELMYLGVPFLAVALTEAQKSYIEMLTEHKLCLNLGPHTSLESTFVKSAVTQLLGDSILQTEFRRRYADLVKPESLGKRLLHVLVS
jgi:UDP-2,4-diacetamido-2,4,6-trideoxy-beta-L-altropyranose hydrolase